MELNPTSYVILGMLGFKPMCGYEIKALVDKSTRFFWAASYGQIYPELGRLSDAGLIEGRSDAASSRRRIEFRLTRAGENRLREWLGDDSQIYEMRDESLLKIFFASAGAPGTLPGALEAKAELHRAVAAQLRELEAQLNENELSGGTGTSLRYGIAFHDFAADWCEGEAKEQRS
jgi:DNA-binding PadR family transcriptional regulator